MGSDALKGFMRSRLSNVLPLVTCSVIECAKRPRLQLEALWVGLPAAAMPDPACQQFLVCEACAKVRKSLYQEALATASEHPKFISEPPHSNRGPTMGCSVSGCTGEAVIGPPLVGQFG